VITTPPHRPRRPPLRALLTAALALTVALAVAGPAVAAASCGKKVIDDWYDNGRVDGTYDLHCYDDAIDALPRDVRDYSSAKEDIERALQNRMQGRPAPPSSNDPSPETTGSNGSGDSGSDDDPSGADDEPDGSGGTGASGPSDEGGVPEAGAGAVDTAASDSVPIPLLVLAGLALLLIAAGSVGYLTRRLQARRAPPTV
jgi:hypothetical protein